MPLFICVSSFKVMAHLTARNITTKHPNSAKSTQQTLPLIPPRSRFLSLPHSRPGTPTPTQLGALGLVLGTGRHNGFATLPFLNRLIILRLKARNHVVVCASKAVIRSRCLVKVVDFRFFEQRLDHLVAPDVVAVSAFAAAPGFAVATEAHFWCWGGAFEAGPVFMCACGVGSEVDFLELALPSCYAVAEFDVGIDGAAGCCCLDSICGEGVLEVWRSCSDDRLEVWWYGPAVIAMVLFSQAGFYIRRPDILACVRRLHIMTTTTI